MQREIMLSAAAAAVIAASAFAPGPALAHGDIVSVKDSYTPGTIVIHTNERRLYYFVGAGEAIRYPVVRYRFHRRQVHQAGVAGPGIDPARLRVAADCRPGRRLGQPDGSGSHDAIGWRRIRHPRHQCTGHDRRVRLARLHPHV
jgi:hypothetical protein